jgi:hypothetical protein
VEISSYTNNGQRQFKHKNLIIGMLEILMQLITLLNVTISVLLWQNLSPELSMLIPPQQ